MNKPRPHIQFSISGHGFGHIAQCAPIIELIVNKHPNIRISIRSEAPFAKLREKLGATVELQHAKLDVGMIQKDALNIDLEKSYLAYNMLHSDWEKKVANEAEQLIDQNIDLVVANISYLSLAAAKKANIPCIAFCSLNWADIYNHYFGLINPNIYRQILGAYQCADFSICPEPSTPMPGIEKKINVGPVGKPLQGREALPIKLNKEHTLVLISWGGMGLKLDIDKWPVEESLHIIVPDEQTIPARNNIYTLKQLNISFNQALQHCDLLVAKPGYGTFVEAAIHGKPIAYLPRNNWPEMDMLVSWFKGVSTCVEISTKEVVNGRFILSLELLQQHRTTSKVVASGNLEATQIILQHLSNVISDSYA